MKDQLRYVETSSKSLKKSPRDAESNILPPLKRLRNATEDEIFKLM
jgi:hypothetical protein